VDAYSEFLEGVMPPERWQALVRVNQRLGTDEIILIPGHGEVETLPFRADNVVVREAVAASPLRPIPLATLAQGKPFPLTADAQGLSAVELEKVYPRGE
jgi:hypothetical protein